MLPTGVTSLEDLLRCFPRCSFLKTAFKKDETANGTKSLEPETSCKRQLNARTLRVHLVQDGGRSGADHVLHACPMLSLPIAELDPIDGSPGQHHVPYLLLDTELWIMYMYFSGVYTVFVPLAMMYEVMYFL